MKGRERHLEWRNLTPSRFVYFASDAAAISFENLSMNAVLSCRNSQSYSDQFDLQQFGLGGTAPLIVRP